MNASRGCSNLLKFRVLFRRYASISFFHGFWIIFSLVCPPQLINSTPFLVTSNDAFSVLNSSL